MTAYETEWYLDMVNPRATADEIAAWLHVSTNAILTACKRAGRDDLRDRLNTNRTHTGKHFGNTPRTTQQKESAAA